MMSKHAQLRQEIVNFLGQFHFFDDKESRKAVLLSAGLDDDIRTINLSGNTLEFLTLVVDQLTQYGAVEEDQPALVRLLEAVMVNIGTDRQQTLRDYCEQLRAQADATRQAIATSPYRSLSAFREEDARFFFGRDGYTEKVVQAVHQHVFFAIVGASGSGKSSLVYAGLLPHLRRAGWAILSFCPGESPLYALSATLMPVWQPGLSREDALVKVKKTVNYFRQNELTFLDIWGDLHTTAPDARLLLFIDQFEETYALCKDAAERACFLHNLMGTVRAESCPERTAQIAIIITLRSDFLAQTQSLPELSHLIADHSLIVPAMTTDELRQAIAEPARVAGQPLDADTVELLLEQTAGREGALPLLQFALTRIWEGLAEGAAPATTLQTIGGVGGALAGEAQRLYDKLSDTDQAIARRAFLALVQLGEGAQDTRRRITVPEMVAHGDDPQRVEAVLRVFAQPDARLVTLSADPGTRRGRRSDPRSPVHALGDVKGMAGTQPGRPAIPAAAGGSRLALGKTRATRRLALASAGSGTAARFPHPRRTGSDPGTDRVL